MSGDMSTIDEIAKQVGASRVTVQRVLNGSFPYARAGAEARAKRIRQLARTLHWRPHAGARATASGRFGAVAILVRRRLGPTHDPVASGAHDALAAQGLRLVFTLVEDDLINNGTIPHLLAERSVDGILVNFACTMPPSLARALRRTGLPIVTINANARHDCVLPDDAEAGSRLVYQLHGVGHRRITYVTVAAADVGAHGHYSLSERLLGYRSACTRLGCTALVVEAPSPQLPLAKRIAAWRHLLQKHRKTTAWIIYQHRDVGAAVAAAAGLGLEIPRDLSIAGFRFESVLDGPGGAISAMMIPFHTCGRQAAEMLIGRLADSSRAHHPSIRVPFLDAGSETIAPPPTTSTTRS